jgi:ADP-heptose:LPS heptosyltransferase
LAGKTNILELVGLIKACRLFISYDSGPYHMGVALKVPTLGVFVKDFPTPITTTLG